MSLEYPEARKSGKPILPVELVPTDKETLHSSFQDIPPCADARDEQALSDALLKAVQKLAIREHDGSPEHDFFIGLAYLNGIDVEVDRERARSLITGAAEEGLPEAVEKLVGMYRGGEGVERDYRAAIQWQEKLADLRRAQYGHSSTEDDGILWVSALWNLGDYQEELADLSAAKQTYEIMCAACEKLNGRYGSEMTRCSIGYDNLGDLSRVESRLTEAKDYYLKSIKLRNQLAEDTGTVEARRDLSISYKHLGDLSNAMGRLGEAEDCYLQSLELDTWLAEETGTVRARRDLSISYNRLGEIREANGRLGEAEDYYLKSLELAIQLAEETGTVEARRDLSVSYGRLGDISMAGGRLTEAKDYYLKSLKLDSQLAEETETVEARQDLSLSYERLGNIGKAEGRLAEAKDYYIKSLELCSQLAEEIWTVKARRDLSVSYDKLGGISEAEGRPEEAEDYYLKGLKLCNQLAEETGTVEARRDLSVSYNRLAGISRMAGRLTEAKDYYLQSMRVFEQLANEIGTVKAWRDLALTYSGMLQILAEMQDSHNLLEYSGKAFVIYMELYRRTESPDDYDGAAIAWFNYGVSAVGDPALKKAALSKAHDIWRELADAYPDVTKYAGHRDLALERIKQRDESE